MSKMRKLALTRQATTCLNTEATKNKLTKVAIACSGNIAIVEVTNHKVANNIGSHQNYVGILPHVHIQLDSLPFLVPKQPFIYF